MTFDPKCYELARYFLPLDIPSSGMLDALAQNIQDAVDAWVESERDNLVEITFKPLS